MSKLQFTIKNTFLNSQILQYLVAILFLYMLYTFYGLDMIIKKEAKDDITPKILYNGQVMKEYVSGPIIVNDHVMVPIRNFTEMLGVKPNWDPNENIMTVRLNNKDLWVQVFNKTAKINGNEVSLPNPVSITYGYVYVPIELVSNVLEMDMKYDKKNYTVYLKNVK